MSTSWGSFSVWLLLLLVACEEREGLGTTATATSVPSAQTRTDASVLTEADAPELATLDASKLAGWMSSECVQDQTRERLVGSLAHGRVLALLDNYGLVGPRKLVEKNENGTFTHDSYSVEFGGAKNLTGEAWQGAGDVVLLVAGSQEYETPEGLRYAEMPCGAGIPTLANRMKAMGGGPVALVLESWSARSTYLVRSVFEYAAQSGTIMLDGAEVSTTSELRQLVQASLAEQADKDPEWVETPGLPPFDPTPPAPPPNGEIPAPRRPK